MQNKYQPALFWFAVLNAIATFLLIGLGGLVTSHEAGMSVPDWPTTYGYNMFLFPVDKWIGGIFYEHSHRLLASVVGLLTTILALWLWLKDPRKWMAWLGIAAFLLVDRARRSRRTARALADGLVWAFRTARVAQIFLVLTCRHRVVHQPLVVEIGNGKTNFCSARAAEPRALRHDFNFRPTHHCRDHAASARRPVHLGFSARAWKNLAGHQRRKPSRITMRIGRKWIIGNPITAFQVNLQMVHRLVAYAIFLGVAAAAFLARKKLGGAMRWRSLRGSGWRCCRCKSAWAPATIWSNKAADMATLPRHGRRAGAADRRAVVAGGRAADAVGGLMVSLN